MHRCPCAVLRLVPLESLPALSLWVNVQLLAMPRTESPIVIVSVLESILLLLVLLEESFVILLEKLS